MKPLKDLLQRVASTIERYRMLDGARRIGVAVSGGADSVCLLDVLIELGAPCVTVLHLDHGLRGAESRGDADFVRDMAARLGCGFLLREADLPRDGNLEQHARRARLAFFRDAVAAGAVDRVAVGHTRSDQAETVLFRILRGAGATGLAGVRPVTADGMVRPLIEVERDDILEYLRARKLPWREDSTNTSARFARNRIRHDLLPALARDWNPRIVSTLAHTAEQAAADEEYWRAEIDRVAAELLSTEAGGVILNAGRIAGLPDAVAGRLIRRAMELIRGDLLGVDFRHVADILRLARSSAGFGRVQAPAVEVRRSFDLIRFGPPPSGRYLIEAVVPGANTIPGTNRAISLELIEKAETLDAGDCVYNGEMGFVDWGRVSGSLTLRNWMPGDRYQPMGSSGVRKLKTLFQLARIPSWERFHWPVLVDGSAIVWTRRFGPAAEYAAGAECRKVLRIRELEAT